MPLSDCSILVADDERINRTILSSRLRKLHVTCSEAQDGKQALALAEREYFDVIFLDIQMPLLNGFEVLARTSHQPSATLGPPPTDER